MGLTSRWRLRPTRARCATLMVGAALVLWSAPAQAPAAVRCTPLQVPVSVAAVPGATLYGELCVPAGAAPRTVQLLVHGATYNHDYYDWPQSPERYSYVQKALNAGYATFNVDRLGSGRSTHPPSAAVTLENGAEALHDVISQLRSGGIGGRAFSRVVWVGHSFGSLYAWIEASNYQDVDAFVLTGLLHSVKPSSLQGTTANMHSVALDPKFADSGLDAGYLTTKPETRGRLFYYAPTSDPNVVALDEQLKDTMTSAELSEGMPLFNRPSAEGAPSRAIKVPTLLVVGDKDGLACGPPDGLECTTANVAQQESLYYSPEAQLETMIVPDTGHDLQLHFSAPATTGNILDWIAKTGV